MIIPNNSFSFQQGKRPCIVTQNNIGNLHSPTVTIAIITSKNKNGLPTHVELLKEHGMKYDSTISFEQIFTIDKKMIIRKLGRCPDYIMEQIDMAIEIQNGTVDRKYINQLIDSINEIEEVASKFGFDPDSMKAHVMHIKELKAYCNQYNYDYYKLVKERLFVKVNEEQRLRNVI
jgi:mRNA interferase MazF